MALSQVQCLDEHHVNLRTNETKPEFFYSEEQRLALEALLTGGPDLFLKVIDKHKVRPFLSQPELEVLARNVERYEPGSHSATDAGPDAGESVSLQYWPDLSDVTCPELDMGWPDCASYRGVTRAYVYTQPPMEGQTHIKEVVRKMIVQASKVIAVVMDIFTDVDIFKDLLDASFKRRVPVYIILEATGIRHFLDMCERAGMHKGHLKNLRVRSIGGTAFYTRSSKKVHGQLSQKFMFVDGDRSMSGSYSFTWTASRLDRNVITVLSGQAAETFDKQFQELYLISTGVNLSKINLEEEPEPEPLPQVVPPPAPSAAVARKLINPKYALVASSNVETGSGTSSEKNSVKNMGNNLPVKKIKAHPEPVEPPPLHPGLIHLERANMISYLPIWPEPDPPSDVIGFINIRDSNKPMQAHLMRSELFETSQAIRFKTPFALAEDKLPEKATLRQHKQSSFDRTATVLEKLPSPSHPQSTPDKPAESPQPQKQSPAALNGHEKADAPTPPVPKPRTVQLVINDGKAPEVISIVNKPITELETLSTPHTAHGQGLLQNPISIEKTDDLDAASANMQDHARITVKQTDGVGVTVTDVNSNIRDCKEVPGMPQIESNLSSTSEEYFECNESGNIESRIELIANGLDSMHMGSGRLEEHRHPDPLNCMARLSQSLVDLRPESKQQVENKEVQNTKALEDIRKVLEKNQKQAYQGQYYPDGKKLYQVMSRSPVSTIRSDRESQSRGPVRVVIAKPGSYHRPTKTAAPVIGGHKYWQSKALNHIKAESSYPTSRGRLASGRNSPNRQQLVNSSQTPFGISLAKLSQVKHLQRRLPAASMGTLPKKTALGHKAV
ncbi:FA83G protein, partial [Amia calva]|nr:FA83G protein [Amia calva]